jgi:hypothetical protein
MTEMDGRNGRRSQRIMLQLAVFLRVEVSEGRCYEIQAFTSVVNAHGGLVEAPTRINPKHRLAIVNPNTGQSADCRIVRVNRTSEGDFSIAFEFKQPNPRFWHIDFPPEDWGAVAEAARNDP